LLLLEDPGRGQGNLIEVQPAGGLTDVATFKVVVDGGGLEPRLAALLCLGGGGNRVLEFTGPHWSRITGAPRALLCSAGTALSGMPVGEHLRG
jgi:hypothetical protein